MTNSVRDDKSPNKVAVRQPANESYAEKIQTYLRSRGWTAVERYLPKDDDELNDRLCRGQFAAVVFAVPEDVMDMIWSGHGAVSRWHAGAGPVEMCFAAETSAGNDWPIVLRRTEASFSAWETGRRRRQVIAGSILSAIALVAMGLLLWLRG